MNLSGQTITLGQWAAGAGGFFAFLSSILGWLGVAVSGSDTSSNSLFGLLQVTAAHQTGLSPTLLAAADSSGGVLGKMISPQNLTIGASAVGMAGQEGELFRRVLGWSLLFLLVMCVLVYLQTTILSGMVVGAQRLGAVCVPAAGPPRGGRPPAHRGPSPRAGRAARRIARPARGPRRS
jgi:lactate permease